MNKRQFMAMLDELSPTVRQAFIASVQKFATSIPLKEVEAAIAANDTVRLFDLLSYDRGDFSIFDRALAEAMAQGGDAAAAYFAGLAKAAGLNTVRAGFDATNPAATAWLRERSSLLVTEIRNETVENVGALLASIRRTLEPGTRDGQSVRTTALDIVGRVNRSTGVREGGILGLTPMEVEWAETAYSELVSGDTAALRNYLDRGPRDRRFDSLVHRAIQDGKPISRDKAAQMVGKYRNRLLQKRGERIARTETIAALNEAKSQSLDKLIADGVVREQDIELEWDASSDSDTRDSHRAMDGQKRPKGQPFLSGDGNLLLYPGDRSNGAPAADIINCFAPWTKIGLVGLEGAVASAYCGDLVEIVVGDGVNLAVTPNHPVLTERGWVSAGEVVEGDQLLQSLRADLGSATAEPNVGDWYASAEQAYEASKRAGRGWRASRTVVDFHGQVPSHDVDVVALPRELRRALDALTGQVFGDVCLPEADILEGGCGLFRSLLLGRSGAASGSGREVRRFYSGVTRLFGHHRRRPAVAFGNTWAVKTHIGKAGINKPTPNAKGIRNAKNGFTGFKQPLDVWRDLFAPLSEHFGALVRSTLRVIPAGVRRQSEVLVARLHDSRTNAYFASHVGDQGTFAMHPADGFKVFGASRREPFGSGVTSPDGDACIVQNLVHSRVLHPLSPRDFWDADPGGVEVNDTGVPLFASVRVKAVSRRHYEGPVYDFQTSTGILLAEGILVHNCRCFVRERIDFIAAAAAGLG